MSEKKEKLLKKPTFSFELFLSYAMALSVGIFPFFVEELTNKDLAVGMSFCAVAILIRLKSMKENYDE